MKPRCPVHVNQIMRDMPNPIPKFDGGDEAAESKAWRNSRIMYRCPVPGCPQVKQEIMRPKSKTILNSGRHQRRGYLTTVCGKDE